MWKKTDERLKNRIYKGRKKAHCLISNLRTVKEVGHVLFTGMWKIKTGCFCTQRNADRETQ